MLPGQFKQHILSPPPLSPSFSFSNRESKSADDVRATQKVHLDLPPPPPPSSSLSLSNRESETADDVGAAHKADSHRATGLHLYAQGAPRDA